MPGKLEQLRLLLLSTIEAKPIMTHWDDQASAYLGGKIFTYMTLSR